MNQTGEKTWDGREWEIWSGSIGELRQLIPTFTIHDFRMGPGINKYKSVIVREPYGSVDIGASVDPVKGMRIPIEVVRKRHEGVVWEDFTPKNVLLGYDLVQHYELLDRVLDTLKAFSKKEVEGIIRMTRLPKPESLGATLEISIYGARMRLEFLVPNFKYDVDDEAPYVLKVVCRNSMDKRIAVEVNLSLYREGSYDIPFRGFYSRHNPEELKDGEIESRLCEELMKIAKGDWINATAEKETIIELIMKTGSEKWRTEIIPIIDRATGSDRINLYWFRQKLAELIADVSKLEMRDQQMIRVLNLFYEIDKVLAKEAQEEVEQAEQEIFNM